LGSGLAIEKRNFSALDYPGFPMIRPDPDGSEAVREYFLIITHTIWKRTDLLILWA